MNCKPGDLAVIFGATVAVECNGMIVEVLRPFLTGELYRGMRNTDTRIAWIVRSCGSPLTFVFGRTGKRIKVSERPIADRFLRPIRPQSDDAVDEMVLIAGKPNQKELTHAN